MKDILEIVISFGLLCTAIYGFYVTNETTRLQTSMDFCSTIFPTLQSEEFISREYYLMRELSKRGDNVCPIEQIDNDTLKQEIYVYCEYMNGIGIMAHEHMINHSVIIPYIGVNSILIYRRLKPYLHLTRQMRADYVDSSLSEEENAKIQKAASLYFVHYELLVLEMERQGASWTRRLKAKLNRAIHK